MSSSSATAVDLSRLPAPTLIDLSDFETIRAAVLAIAQTYYPDFSAVVESDPVYKLCEAFAYRELLLRAEFNDAAKGLLLAYAAGATLDQLGILMGVVRLVISPADAAAGTDAVMESDDAFRARIVLAPESFSVAGPVGAYNFHARSADGMVRDASATSPAPCQVVVTVLSTAGDGTPSADLLAKVAAVVNADDVRPLTDQVTVQAAQILPFVVDATLHLLDGPDAGVVQNTATARLQAYLSPAFPLGYGVAISGIYAALFVEGVRRVELRSPTADIVASDLQAAFCASITIATTVDG